MNPNVIETIQDMVKYPSYLSPEVRYTISLLIVKYADSDIHNIFNTQGEAVVWYVNDSFHKLLESKSQTRSAVYRHTLSLITCTNIESLLFLIVIHLKASKSSTGGVLLKVLLSERCLAERIPSHVLQILRYLFLPDGLNLRNLLWHGFMSPDEDDDKYLLILLSLQNDLLNIYRSIELSKSMTSTSFNRYDLQTQLQLFDSKCSEILLIFKPCLEVIRGIPFTMLCNYLRRQSSIPVSMMELFLAGVDDLLIHEWSYMALHRLLPVLEHTLRIVFCSINGIHDISYHQYVYAQQGKYYSTLDGFGQRSKHQLLLDPKLTTLSIKTETNVEQVNDRYSTRTPADKMNIPSLLDHNRLPHLLSDGLYGLLIDLFMTDDGPNLRAQLAHGYSISNHILRSVFPGNDSSIEQLSTFVSMEWCLDPNNILNKCFYSGCWLIVISLIRLIMLFDTTTSSNLQSVSDVSEVLLSIDDRNSVYDSLFAIVGVIDGYESKYHRYVQLMNFYRRSMPKITAFHEFLGLRAISMVQESSTAVSIGENELKDRLVSVTIRAPRIIDEINQNGVLHVFEEGKFVEKYSKILDIVGMDILNGTTVQSGIDLKTSSIMIIEMCKEYITSLIVNPQHRRDQLLMHLNDLFILRPNIFDSNYSSSAAINIQERMTGDVNLLDIIDRLLSPILNLRSIEYIPLIPCLMEILKIIDLMIDECIESCLYLENEIIHGFNRTNHRRKCLSVMFQLCPVTLALSLLAIALSMEYLLVLSVNGLDELHVDSFQVLFTRLLSMMKSFRTCIPMYSNQQNNSMTSNTCAVDSTKEIRDSTGKYIDFDQELRTIVTNECKEKKEQKYLSSESTNENKKSIDKAINILLESLHNKRFMQALQDLITCSRQNLSCVESTDPNDKVRQG